MKRENTLPSLSDTFKNGLMMKSDNTGIKDPTAGLIHKFKKMNLKPVRSIALNPEGNQLFITFQQNEEEKIRVIDFEKFDFLNAPFGKHHRHSIRQICFSKQNPDIFYTASWDNTCKCISVNNNKLIKSYTGFGAACSVVLSKDEKYLFTATYDMDIDVDGKNTVRMWDIQAHEVARYFVHGNNRSHRAESISMDTFGEDLVVTGSDDGVLRLNDMNGQVLLTYLNKPGTVVRRIFCSENLIAASTHPNTCYVFKKTGEYLKDFNWNNEEIIDLKIDQEETKLWISTGCGSVALYDLRNQGLIWQKKYHSREIWSIILKNELLITSSFDGTICFLNSFTGELLARMYVAEEKEIIFECPKDDNTLFPNGFFYCSNPATCIDVFSGEDPIPENDPRWLEYIEKHNLRNLLYSRIFKNQRFNSLIENYLQNRKILNESIDPKFPLSLKS